MCVLDTSRCAQSAPEKNCKGSTSPTQKGSFTLPVFVESNNNFFRVTRSLG